MIYNVKTNSAFCRLEKMQYFKQRIQSMIESIFCKKVILGHSEMMICWLILFSKNLNVIETFMTYICTINARFINRTFHKNWYKIWVIFLSLGVDTTNFKFVTRYPTYCTLGTCLNFLTCVKAKCLKIKTWNRIQLFVFTYRMGGGRFLNLTGW